MSPVDPAIGSLRRRDGEPPFAEPWHAETLAMADCLARSGRVSAARWGEALGAEIAAARAAGGGDDADAYFRGALSALTRLLAETGAVASAELDARQRQWERAYRNTPHGRPVELSAGSAPR